MLLKNVLDLRHSVAFRLTLLYAGVFTVSLCVISLAFYVFVLYGSHGLSHRALSSIREDFREYFTWSLLFGIILSAFVGWFMARKALSGVVDLTNTATAVADGALQKRVPVKGREDEIDRLAVTFNVMLEKIQLLISGMKETNDNIAHDLRSPVTRMRGMAEAALTDVDANEGCLVLAGNIVEECDRLLGMINAMLDISEAEAGVALLDIEETDLVSMIRDALELYRPLAEDKGIEIRMEMPGSLCLCTDKRKLQRVLSNLLDNAIKFTLPGGTITASAETAGKEVRIEIADTGIGMTPEDLPHIFERFFRAEKSRSQPGNGLGLSLAKAYIGLLQGSIHATNNPGGGSILTVILPREISSS